MMLQSLKGILRSLLRAAPRNRTDRLTAGMGGEDESEPAKRQEGELGSSARLVELPEDCESLRQLVESVGEVFWLHTAHREQFAYLSPAFEQIWGRTRDGLYADPQVWSEALHPEDRQRITELTGKAMTAGETWACEYRIVLPDGRVRWISDRGFPVRDAVGQIHRFAGIAGDVTESRTLQERYTNFIAGSPDLLLMGRFSGKLLHVNPAVERMLGCPVEEILETSLKSFCSLEDLPRLSSTLTAVAQGDGPEVCECRWGGGDGSPRWIRWNISASEDGQSFYASGHDITKRRRLEAALEERARLAFFELRVKDTVARATNLRKLFRECAEAMIYHGVADAVQLWKMLPDGAGLELNARREVSSIVENPPQRIPLSSQAVGRIARSKEPFEADSLAGFDGGDAAWARSEGIQAFTGYPLLAGGRFVGVLAIFGRAAFSEPTRLVLSSVAGSVAVGIERQLVAKELRAAKAAAEATSRTKSEFLANVSHEIRTPMNGILGLTELVLEMELSDEQRQCLSAVKQSGETLLCIIDDVLDFTKIESGKLALNATPFELRALLGNLLRTLAVRAHEKGLELIQDVEEDVPDTLIGDPVRLWQVVVNLIGNALKFTHQGEVVLHVEAEELTAESACLYFSIRDTGIGIPHDKQADIFESFTQVDGSTTRLYGGSGLGLPIAAQLVEMMNGRLWVESDLDEGSCFRFTACFGRRVVTSGRRAPAQPPLTGHKALVVDDNRTNCEVIAVALTRRGMKTTQAGDGAAALEALHRAAADGEAFEVVVLDARMPELDGFATLEQIRQGLQDEMPVILMLITTDQEKSKERAEAMGATACLIKPIDPSQLENVVANALGLTETLTAAHLSAPPGSAASAGPKLRVLIAEDNQINQALAVRLLTRAGHSIKVAGNGEEVLEILEHEPFDLVLMDVQMPRMDGLQATRLIRERERHTGAHLPIVAMTAHAISGDREQCLQAGMDGYVSKPIRVNALFSAMADAVADREQVLKKETASGAQCDGDDAQCDGDDSFHASADELAFRQELTEMFLNDCPESLAEIREAIEHRDDRRLKQAAHKLKGSAGVFRDVPAAQKAAQQMECIGAEANWDQVENAWTNLVTEMDRLMTTLQKASSPPIPVEE